jgi:hypothetical protein
VGTAAFFLFGLPQMWHAVFRLVAIPRYNRLRICHSHLPSSR